ncbi:MAG TPA: hypothetical protein RMH99_15760 [Sandaracinaceae bacterium LLY-WYZ-13_1]|nr:hypothetical protein [Sandaracinaceae bacterium LLY-WYZ-13_1]
MRPLAFAAALLALPVPAQAQPRVEGVIHQRLVGQLNPEGAEHALRLGVRAPLGDPDAMIFTGAHAEAGVVSYASPIYANQGGYLQVSPLALLVLRAEILSTTMWSIGMPGAGYYPVDGYGADLSAENLRGERGGEASGWTVRLSAVVQGAVPLGPARLLLYDEVAAEHVSLGDAAHHYHPRYDLVLSRQEWTIGNHAMLLAELDLAPDARLRVGAYDALQSVPASGALTNQVGGVAMLQLTHLDDAVDELMPLARLGAYTHHERREGDVTFLLGLFVRYALR